MSAFVDEAQLHVKAGDGGAGAVAFRREPFVPQGGPDGGNGGDGGDVWVVADRNVASLLAFRDHPFRRAADGTHGGGNGKHGRGGEAIEVAVPVGTVISDLDGSVLADLAAAGHRWKAAEGGRGGRGNQSFLSNRRRAPNFAEQGEVGEERWCNLELKLMADVALVGFPNAGKSTLISVISAAKPKIADYPFTTLEPHLGVVRLPGFGTDTDPRGDAEFVVADIPGLIEGASDGKGLGFQFLRHVERARVLLVLVDLSAERSPHEQERVLVEELRRYRPELLERPRLVVGTKLDAIGALGASRADLELLVPDAPALCISAVTGEGIQQLLRALAPMVAAARLREPAGELYVVHRPAAMSLQVRRDDDGSWVVLGRDAVRAVAMSDLTNPQVLAELQRRIVRLGVDKALARAGARSGDHVRIGGFEFDYED
jgi:GTP-binding protein